MAVLSLVLIVVWLLLVGGLRGYLGYRRSGAVAIRFRDPPGSPQWWARLVSSVGLGLTIAAPIAELAGMQAILDHMAVRLVGVGLAIVGIAATLAAQWSMGDSWRGDVDPDARTALVTSGPFRLVRNPILTSTAATAVGFALMVPNIVAALMLVAFVLAYEIQVRLVEEPYLLRTYGDDYRRYAARTGRFLPGIGRLSDRDR